MSNWKEFLKKTGLMAVAAATATQSVTATVAISAARNRAKKFKNIKPNKK